MGSKKIGRPKAPSFVLNIIRTKILQYRRRYKTTSWNAWTRLTTHKQFKELVKEFYKRHDSFEDKIHSVYKKTSMITYQKVM